MFLGGLWHGAQWTFVLWGLIHGSILVIERISRTNNFSKKLPNPISLAQITGEEYDLTEIVRIFEAELLQLKSQMTTEADEI